MVFHLTRSVSSAAILCCCLTLINLEPPTTVNGLDVDNLEISKKDRDDYFQIGNDVLPTETISSGGGRRKRQVFEDSHKDFKNPCGTDRAIDEPMADTNDFCELVLANDVFVDKSLLIHEFLKMELYMPIIKRPRGWGKTINMNMVKRFVEMSIDAHGNKIPANASENINRKLFLGGEIELPHKGRKLLKRLKIAEHRDLVDYYMGNYPVIYVNFEDAIGDDYQEMEPRIKRVIADVYRQHGYLLERLTDENYIATFKRYLNGVNLTRTDLESSLYHLSAMLFNTYNQYVYIFVDEYNTPMNHLYMQLIRDRCSEVKHSRRFSEPLEFFLHFFRDSMRFNEFMMQGLITGVSHVPHMYMYFKGDLYPEYTLQSAEFADHYGFTEAEVNGLLAKTTAFEVNADGLKSWYCGYQSSNKEGGELCNPYSVMHTLWNGGRFEPYWLDDKETAVFDEHLLSAWFQKNLQKIVAGEKVYSRITKPYDFHRYGRYAHFISILMFHGYITPNGTSGSMLKFRVPNDELRLFYEKKFRMWLDSKLEFEDGKTDNEYVRLLLTGQIEAFSDKVKRGIRMFLTDYQAKGTERERLYNSILISFLKSPDCRVLSGDSRNTALSRKPCLLVEPITDRYTNASMIAIRMVTRKKFIFRTLRSSLNELDESDHWEQVRINQFERLIKLSMAFTGLDFDTRLEIVNPRMQKRRKKKQLTDSSNNATCSSSSDVTDDTVTDNINDTNLSSSSAAN